MKYKVKKFYSFFFLETMNGQKYSVSNFELFVDKISFKILYLNSQLVHFNTKDKLNSILYEKIK